jgi:hypothetical protein
MANGQHRVIVESLVIGRKGPDPLARPSSQKTAVFGERGRRDNFEKLGALAKDTCKPASE